MFPSVIENLTDWWLPSASYAICVCCCLVKATKTIVLSHCGIMAVVLIMLNGFSSTLLTFGFFLPLLPKKWNPLLFLEP